MIKQTQKKIHHALNLTDNETEQIIQNMDILTDNRILNQ